MDIEIYRKALFCSHLCNTGLESSMSGRETDVVWYIWIKIFDKIFIIILEMIKTDTLTIFNSLKESAENVATAVTTHNKVSTLSSLVQFHENYGARAQNTDTICCIILRKTTMGTQFPTVCDSVNVCIYVCIYVRLIGCEADMLTKQ